MSTNPKKDDEKTVFDGGEFGIGHNQGPPLDDREAIAAEAEADANADTDTQSVKHQGKPRGQVLSDANKAYLKNLEKTKQLEKITWDSPYGSEELEARVTALLTGQTDGLISRGGKRRILPESHHREKVEGDLEKLVEIAKQVLHRRNASIFDAHVIKPLAEGKRHPPVEETARQFNVTPKRIYKIIGKCWQKVREAVPRFMEGRRLDGEQQSPFCGICGRHESSSGLCARGGYGVCSRPLPWRFRYLPKITAEEALRKPTKEEALQVEKWITQERTERAQRAKEWQDYLIKTFEHWEAHYGPGRKPQLSEFFSSPGRKGK